MGIFGARADDFDFHSAVRCQASLQRRRYTVTRASLDLILFALAFRVDAVRVDTLADQVRLDRRRTTLRQTLVVTVGTHCGKVPIFR